MRFNKLIPELSVSDFEKSRDFYTRVLGFKEEYSRKNFVFLSLEKSQIMIDKINNSWKTGKMEYPFGRGINLQIEVKNINKIISALKKEKHPLFRKPETNWYRKGNSLLGCREFLVQDPDGYLLRFSEDAGSKPVPFKKLR